MSPLKNLLNLGMASEATPVNMAHHSYFNLAGIYEHCVFVFFLFVFCIFYILSTWPNHSYLDLAGHQAGSSALYNHSIKTWATWWLYNFY